MHVNRFSFLLPLCLALSAFLLFVCQPLVGRLLLPLVGGTPAGWLAVLCFFQLALLAGYVLAQLTARRGARWQLRFALVALALSAITSSFQFSAQTQDWTLWQVLFLLSPHLALPALVLAFLSPVLQHFAANQPETVQPYRLYAASNAGSLLGLLAYPFLVEPFLPLALQGQLWLGGLAVLAALLLYVLLLPAQAERAAINTVPLALKPWLLVAFFAALPAGLSVALAGLLSAEFGTLPLIWLVPLLLYLLSFIVAFGWPANQKPPYSGLFACGLTLLALALTVLGYSVLSLVTLSLGFYLAALHAHMRVVELQPAAQSLPHYYVALAAGGALGGLFCTALAPVLFNYPVEYGFLLSALALSVVGGQTYPKLQRSIGALIGFGCLALLLLGEIVPGTHVYRNFFGVSVVSERMNAHGQLYRYLSSGAGIQGAQNISHSGQPVPDLYFKVLEPIFANPTLTQVGVLGAGVGIAACLTAPSGAPARQFTYYEIDPKHRLIAERDFTYFKYCGAPNWRMGDARLELAAASTARYDVLLVDAFQGGLIPLHLITREAFALYRQRLSEQGFLLYNLNSLYYDFFPQMAAQAAEVGWQIWRAPDTWALLAPPQLQLQSLAALGWQPVNARPGVKVWSDDHAHLLGALRQ